MSIGTTIELTTIQNYTIIAEANGFAIGKSPTAPSPYAVWQIDNDGNGVSCGHYFVDRKEAEWDFCARAFEWFEDNVYVHMVEDGEKEQQPVDDTLLKGLREIRAHMASATQLVDEMCAEVDRLMAKREANKCHQR